MRSGGDLQLIDTPGSNAMAQKLEHNIWIAHALNSDPVNLTLFVVKADARIDNTIATTLDYLERFQDFEEFLAVCVTHMDMVAWQENRFRECLQQQSGMDALMFVGKESKRSQVKSYMVGLCGKPHDLSITSDNFLKYFRVNGSNFKILRTCRREVTRFQTIKQQFMAKFDCGTWTYRDGVDLVFELQAWMLEQVYSAQQRVAEENKFTFDGDEQVQANEASHVANLTSQLRGVLMEVRILAFGYRCEISTELRKCPHCNTVWTKVEGCDGNTTCGNMVSVGLDTRFTSLANFDFRFDGDHLHIVKRASRTLQRQTASKSRAGCGQTIS